MRVPHPPHTPLKLESSDMAHDSSDHAPPPQRAAQAPPSQSDAGLQGWITQILQEQAHTRLLPLQNSEELPKHIARREPFKLTLTGEPDRDSENQAVRFSPVPGEPDRWQLTFDKGSPGTAVDLYGAEWIWPRFPPTAIDVSAVDPVVDKRPSTVATPKNRTSAPQQPVEAKAEVGTFIDPPPVDRTSSPLPSIPVTPPAPKPTSWFKEEQIGVPSPRGELWLELPIDSAMEEACWGIAEVTRHGEPTDPPLVIELKRLKSRRDWFRGHLAGSPRPSRGAKVIVRPLEAVDLWRLDPARGEVTRFLESQDFRVLPIHAHAGEEHLCVAANDRALQRPCTWFLGVLTSAAGGAT